MQTVLHIGCHRSGTTTFQAYLRANEAGLRRKGLEVWEPRRTRDGLFAGLMPTRPGKPAEAAAARAAGRVRVNHDLAATRGATALLVSDENMIGSVRANLRAGTLYPAIGERMARYASAFDGRLTRLVLSIRSQDRYWASAISYAVARGAPVPDAAKLAKIAANPRTWRDVITDLACAVPEVEIRVMPFDAFDANPGTFLEQACHLPAADVTNYDWLNRTPTLPELRNLLSERGDDPACLPAGQGRWSPFSRAQAARMQEQFEDDLFWLAAGAEGLATLTEHAMPGGRGKAHRAGARRGHDHDQEGSLEQTG